MAFDQFGAILGVLLIHQAECDRLRRDEYAAQQRYEDLHGKCYAAQLLRNSAGIFGVGSRFDFRCGAVTDIAGMQSASRFVSHSVLRHFSSLLCLCFSLKRKPLPDFYLFASARMRSAQSSKNLSGSP
jgi:hypothetical protein